MSSNTSALPLNELVAWDGNVRKTVGADTALAELAASIAAHGLLQSLVVRKTRKGKYAVVAGGRRLAALQSLAEAGRIAADHPVPCHLIANDIDAAEIGLAENAVRENMHPADEFEAFRDLIEKGLAVDDIAARFGVTPRVVEQRLKLARVSPAIIRAFREGALNLAQVMAFAVSDGHEAQERVLENLSHYNDDPVDIRDALTEDEIAASDRRVKFVTLKAYEKAGGAVRRDLFAEGDFGIFILDSAILDQLVTKKLARTAKQVASEGWKWVEIRSRYEWSEWNACERAYMQAPPLPALEQAELDALTAEYNAICDLEGELTDGQSARQDEISARIEEVENREHAWLPETLAIAGAVVSVGNDGQADVTRGLIRPADKPAKTAKARTAAAVTETVEAATGPLPAPLIESLTAQHSAAIAASLADNASLALVALVHTVALQSCYSGRSRDTCLQVTSSPKSLRGTESSLAAEVMTRHRTSWSDRLPGDPACLWAWCCEQTQHRLLELLAYCMACSVNAVQAKADGPGGERLAHADDLAAALKVNMREWFKPTAENYFTKISRAGILEALKDGKGAIAPAWTTARKSDLACIAERELANTGWLPLLLRRAG